MKKNNLLLTCVLILLGGISIQSTIIQDISGITTAIKSANAKQLATYFDNMVEIKINEQEGTYSKAQAEQVVKDFFAKNKVKNFTIKHEGPSSNNAAYYAIGELQTATGNYRTYIYMKKKGDTFIIQELSFENEKP